jgi:hypothetical protein
MTADRANYFTPGLESGNAANQSLEEAHITETAFTTVIIEAQIHRGELLGDHR